MTQKPFEDLTISDDFMFCKVMESEPICKEFLEMLFATKIDKITYLSTQDSVTTNIECKNRPAGCTGKRQCRYIL